MNSEQLNNFTPFYRNIYIYIYMYIYIYINYNKNSYY